MEHLPREPPRVGAEAPRETRDMDFIRMEARRHQDALLKSAAADGAGL
jgi:hypothetical protein